MFIYDDKVDNFKYAMIVLGQMPYFSSLAWEIRLDGKLKENF